MENTMERWYNAIKNRTSIRKYTSSADQSEYKRLKEAARYFSTDEVRIVVGRKEGALSPLIGRSVSGTDTFAAILCCDKELEYMVGMVGESFVLECASMGLGTCWLGLSYNRSAVNSCIKYSSDKEKLRCVIAFGHYDEQPDKKRMRKTISNLIGLSDGDFKKLPEWQQTAVQCGRLAPSALNAQPWEFDILSDKSMQVANISKNFGYGEIDVGIAMLHIEVGAAHCGVYGDWEVSDGLPLFTVDDSIEV